MTYDRAAYKQKLLSCLQAELKSKGYTLSDVSLNHITDALTSQELLQAKLKTMCIEEKQQVSSIATEALDSEDMELMEIAHKLIMTYGK